MKKCLLVLFFAFTSNFIHAQQLENTQWYNSNLGFYLRFDYDTLWTGTDGYTWMPTSWFGESGGNMWIFDLPTTAVCNDTGDYTISITSGYLTFYSILDNCSSRMGVLTGGQWLQLSTGIDEKNVSDIKSFTSDKVLNLLVSNPKNESFSIIDMTGKVVYSGSILTEHNRYNLEMLKSGIYTVIFSGEKHKEIRIII